MITIIENNKYSFAVPRLSVTGYIINICLAGDSRWYGDAERCIHISAAILADSLRLAG